MISLTPYVQPLTAKTAAHLLRRATFGPTQAEITAFTGLTAQQAVQQLISNAIYAPPPPVDLDENSPTAGQPYISLPFNNDRSFFLGHYLRLWWLGLMTAQTTPPTLLEKLALFWQNHFVTTRTIVEDYRFLFRYMQLIRSSALGNFRTFVKDITKDPAMLRYLNGDENQAGKPNENYGRELQELFTVGVVDPDGNKNYTEDDVKAAAKVLTGWGHTNFNANGSTTIGTTFTDSLHDSTNKTFSGHYNNTVITGRAVSSPGTMSAGEAELADLVNMLLAHPQCGLFICRKLYRWYVNQNITADAETNVIVPLAAFFVSPVNNFAIESVVTKLLMSQAFFDAANAGAIVKSPADLVVGAMRFFNQPLPNALTDYTAFYKYTNFMYYQMNDMQMGLVDQPSVFGHEAYYQTGFSKLWINTTTIGIRSSLTDAFIWRWLVVKPGYKMGIDLLAWAASLQPNFANPAGTPSITCEQILAGLTKNLFAADLTLSQQDFLIDTIMMQGIPRLAWTFEWNKYRTDPTNGGDRYSVLWRLQNLMKFMLRMAEYHIL